MSYRRLASDCAIAILLALPTIPLARPTAQLPVAASEAEREAVTAAFNAHVSEAGKG